MKNVNTNINIEARSPKSILYLIGSVTGVIGLYLNQIQFLILGLGLIWIGSES